MEETRILNYGAQNLGLLINMPLTKPSNGWLNPNIFKSIYNILLTNKLKDASQKVYQTSV